ncbi:hypothetical protein DFP91_0318 [Pseudorhodoplanes sinuspersici]|uniref:Uncharacterized protein n=1 Tax=Pseudorhodoplanes sinuspersici TaxID=1235591 RepID=A0A1W6ZVR7_9HYPH|nr:hypothetical protein CAK95_18380 [Pseudorhodoplanes sinuspersici]RKE72452.1 hypothetical protein DFP91_0318 [Pseudorhodoplanes sinuspersici]
MSEKRARLCTPVLCGAERHIAGDRCRGVGRRIIVVRVFIKKTQKTPQRAGHEAVGWTELIPRPRDWSVMFAFAA